MIPAVLPRLRCRSSVQAARDESIWRGLFMGWWPSFDDAVKAVYSEADILNLVRAKVRDKRVGVYWTEREGMARQFAIGEALGSYTGDMPRTEAPVRLGVILEGRVAEADVLRRPGQNVSLDDLPMAFAAEEEVTLRPGAKVDVVGIQVEITDARGYPLDSFEVGAGLTMQAGRYRKPDEPGPWFHASLVELPVGTILTPASERGHKGNFPVLYATEKDRRNWVWISPTADQASMFLEILYEQAPAFMRPESKDIFVYEVEPTGTDWGPDDLSPITGDYRCRRATIVRQVGHTKMAKTAAITRKLPAKEIQQLLAQDWFHGGERPEGGATIHVGTYKAAEQRTDPNGWEPPTEFPGLISARIYRLRLDPSTRIHPGLFDDGEAGSLSFRFPDGVDAVAYTNDFEDAGSISLVVKPSKIRVVEVMPDTHMADRAKVAQEFADWFRDDPQGAEDYFGPDGMREIAGKIRERFPQVKLGASAITLPDGTPVEFRLEKNVPMVGVARGGRRLVALVDGKKAGEIIHKEISPMSAHVGMIRVYPNFQRRGVATALWERLAQTYPYIDVTPWTEQGQAWWDAYKASHPGVSEPGIGFVSSRTAAATYFHGTIYDLPDGTVLMGADEAGIDPNWDYEDGSFDPTVVWMSHDQEWAEQWGVWAATNAPGVRKVYVYEVEPVGGVTEHPNSIAGSVTSPSARIVRKVVELDQREVLRRKRSQRQAALSVAWKEGGRYGRRDHPTMEERGTIPTKVLEHMPGQCGEVPGAHRNKHGKVWEDFKADLTANGMHNGIFICIEPGEPIRIWEGNHRRDAAVEMGWAEVPVQIRYFGHAEQDGTLMERYAKGGRWMDGYIDTERVEREEREREQRWASKTASDGPWYHASTASLPVGTVLVPGGPERQFTFPDLYERQPWRGEWVWMSQLPQLAVKTLTNYAKVDEGEIRLYRVEPIGTVSMDGDMAEGRGPSARIVEEVDLSGNAVTAAVTEDRDAQYRHQEVFFHATTAKLPPGTKLVPAAQRGEGNWAYGNGIVSLDNANWVWMSTLPEQAREWAVAASMFVNDDPIYVYAVKPEGRLHNEYGTEFRDWKAESATVLYEVTRLRLTADYRGDHQPLEGAPPLHDLLDGTMFPKDVYENLEHYTSRPRPVVGIVRSVRGKPNAKVTVYRALPPGNDTIESGNWVTLEVGYAKMHGEGRLREFWDEDKEWELPSGTKGKGEWVEYDPPRDWPVIAAEVEARYVRNGGNDLNEWGYFGPPVKARKVAKVSAIDKAQLEHASELWFADYTYGPLREIAVKNLERAPRLYRGVYWYDEDEWNEAHGSLMRDGITFGGASSTFPFQSFSEDREIGMAFTDGGECGALFVVDGMEGFPLWKHLDLSKHERAAREKEWIVTGQRVKFDRFEEKDGWLRIYYGRSVGRVASKTGYGRTASREGWTKDDIDFHPGGLVRSRPGVTSWLIQDFSEPMAPVVGAIAFRDLNSKVVIESLQVNPAYRRQGVGSLLLRTLLAHAERYYMDVDPGEFTPDGAKLWKAVTGEDVRATQKMPDANDARRYRVGARPSDSNRRWTKDTYSLESLRMEREDLGKAEAEAFVNRILADEGIPHQVKIWFGGGEPNTASAMWDWMDESPHITVGAAIPLTRSVLVHEASHLVNQWLHDRDTDIPMSDGHGQKWRQIYGRLGWKYLGRSPWEAAGVAGLSIAADLSAEAGAADVYEGEAWVRHHLQPKGGTMASMQALFRRILKDEGVPRAEVAYLEDSGEPRRSHIGLDDTTEPTERPIPFISVGGEMVDAITIIHEAAHLVDLWNTKRLYRDFRPRSRNQWQGTPDTAHGPSFVATFDRLLWEWAGVHLPKAAGRVAAVGPDYYRLVEETLAESKAKGTSDFGSTAEAEQFVRSIIPDVDVTVKVTHEDMNGNMVLGAKAWVYRSRGKWFMSLRPEHATKEVAIHEIAHIIDVERNGDYPAQSGDRIDLHQSWAHGPRFQEVLAELQGRRLASAPKVPPRPGTKPIPSGHVRLWTKVGASGQSSATAQVIAREGLRIDKAQVYKDAFGDFRAIWAAVGHPEVENIRGADCIVEFSAPAKEVGTTTEGAHVTLARDVPPSEFLAIYERWHGAYWELVDESGWDKAFFADHDNDWYWNRGSPDDYLSDADWDKAVAAFKAKLGVTSSRASSTRSAP